MTITPAQRIAISQLWNSVCKDLGWKSSDRALRLETLGGFLGRPITTMDEIERLAECTQVMAELKAMLGVSVRAGLEATDPSRNKKRNARWIIVHEILPCLALYPLDAPSGLDGAGNYLVEVMQDKSRWRKMDRPESSPSLADFDERTVTQILWTLSARLNVKRKAAGHSGHEMKMAAGVRCDCATFCRGKAAVIPGLQAGEKDASQVEVLAGSEDPDWGI